MPFQTSCAVVSSGLAIDLTFLCPSPFETIVADPKACGVGRYFTKSSRGNSCGKEPVR